MPGGSRWREGLDRWCGGMRHVAAPYDRRFPWLLVVAQALLLAVSGVGLAAWWKPEPHSDWLYYWMAAGEPGLYVRGGASLWLLALPKAFGASPLVAALLLNVLAAVWLLFIAYRLDPIRWHLLAQLVFLYLLLIAPFAGIVQLDLVAAAQLGTALWLLADPRLKLPQRWRIGLAIGFAAFAVSTKPQYALVIWLMFALALPVGLVFRRWPIAAFSNLLLVLFVGSTLGFALDMAMRVSSGKTEEIRTSSAVTLYGGLLVSSDQPSKGCGYWSVEAAQAAKDDLHKSLSVAVGDRLRAAPLGHWVSVVRCKVPEILSPPPYALYWLIESPNVRAGIDARADKVRIDALYFQAMTVERAAYAWTRLLVLLACAWTALALLLRKQPLAVVPVLWLVGFWGVHAVFEIQGRYFLGMFVLAPILCAAVWLLSVLQRAPARGAA